MQADWQSHPIYTRDNGSYVITLNGLPYHVPPHLEEFEALWIAVDEFAKANPNQVEPEPQMRFFSLEDTRQLKLGEIRAGYDAALAATVTMPAADPTPGQVSANQALFAAEDPEGFETVLSVLASRRAELEAQANAAQAYEEIDAVVVRYPV